MCATLIKEEECLSLEKIKNKNERKGQILSHFSSLGFLG
jgi:hypothetical protein